MNGAASTIHASTCGDCLAWGALRNRHRCGGCASFAGLHAHGTCDACHRELPIKQGFCRLCWIQANRDSGGGAKHLQPFLEQVRHHQLFLANMRWRGRHKTRHPSRQDGHGTDPSRDRPPRPDHPLAAGWHQPRLLDVPKDFTRFDRTRHARPDNPWVIRARHTATAIAEAHGWGRWTHIAINQAITMLLSGHQDGDLIRHSELFPAMRQHRLNVNRTIEVLDRLGIYVDDRTPTLDRWLHRRLAGLTPAIRADVDAWAHALVEGTRRTRPRSRSTLQAYLDHLQPVLTDWSHDVEHLREITRDDIITARDTRHGATRETTIVALRSLFRFCQRTGRVFHDPTTRVRTTHRSRPIPIPLQPDELGQAVTASVTPADRVVLALAAIHAARPGDIRLLQLTDLDIPNRRLTIGGQARPLDEPTRLILVDWLTERRQRWPNTANPHVLVSTNTALGLRPVGANTITVAVRGLTATIDRLRKDRQLNEALASGADPLHLAAVFGLDPGTAVRYAEAARQLLTTAAEEHDLGFVTNTTRHRGKIGDQPSGSG